MRNIIILMLVLISGNVQAAEIAGVKFNPIYQDHGAAMMLQGTGLKSVFFIKAFAAGFYKGEGANTDLLGNFPKRIEVQYFVNIPGAKLNNFTINTMKDNVSKEELEAISGKVKEMGQYFVDLKPGDRFALTYIPNIGTQFTHNGHLTGIVEGLDFARALLDRKSTRLNSSHLRLSRMPSSA